MKTEKQIHMIDCPISGRSKLMKKAPQPSVIHCSLRERNLPMKRAARKVQYTKCYKQDNNQTVRSDESEEYVYPLSKRNRRAVQARCWKAQQERTQKLRASSASYQLGTFLTSWLKIRRPSLKPAIYDAYRTCLSRKLLPVLGQVALREVTDEQIEACLRQVSASQLPLIHTILSQAFADAVAWRRMTTNPYEGLETPYNLHPNECSHSMTQDGKEVQP